MGAGTSKAHKVQDAGEKYCVYQLQKMAVDQGKSISGSYKDQKNEFINYCLERSIEADFNKSEYKKIYDLHLSSFFDDLKHKHPNSNFDFLDIEAEFRNQNKKGDFLIVLSEGTVSKSVSLKTYKKGFERPQLCSGTWGSFVLNMLLEKTGVGMYEDIDGTRYKSSNTKKRDKHLSSLGFDTAEVKDYFNWYDNVCLPYVKKTYRDSGEAKFFQDVKEKWKQDCHSLAHTAIDKAIDVFRSLPNNTIKHNIMKMAGLYGDEELLLMSPKKYIFSHTNTNYGNILRRINANDCKLEFRKHEKNIFFVFSDNHGDILIVQVPFTLQSNGAWHRPTDNVYEGLQYHEKEKMHLAWGQRRPKKSKELATSINTYVNLKDALAA